MHENVRQTRPAAGRKPAPRKPAEREERKDLGQEAAYSNPRLNASDMLMRKVSAPLKRAFGELERMQVKAERAEVRAYATSVVDQIGGFLKSELTRSKADAVVLTDANAPLPTEGSAWLVGTSDPLLLERAWSSFGVYAASVERGKLMTLFFFQPALNAVYTAEQGAGASSPSLRCRVAGTMQLSDALVRVVTGQATEKTAKATEKLKSAFAAEGAAVLEDKDFWTALWDVLGGRSDVFVGQNLTLHQEALAMFLGAEAGAHIIQPSAETLVLTTEKLEGSLKAVL